MKKHFRLTEEFKINALGIKLFRIVATRKTKYVEDGTLGGWVESENLPNGDARVYGDAWVSGDADIKTDNDICWFSKFGSSNRTTTFFKTKEENVIKVVCGCFHGTIKEFLSQVKKTHGSNQFAKEYESIVKVVKIKFQIK